MRRQTNNIFIINQSFLDLFASVMTMATSYIQLGQTGLSGLGAELHCRLWVAKPILWDLLESSTFNLLSISLERYIAIVHPMAHMVKLTKDRIKLWLILIWMFGPILQLLFTISTTGLVNGTCVLGGKFTSLLAMQVAMISIVMIAFYIPLFIMIFCYAKMYRI